MAGYSKSSLQTIARWGGEHTIAHGSKQRPTGLRGSVSASQSETRTAVLNVRDLIRRSRDEVLVLTIGAEPTWLRKVRYYEDERFRGLFDAPSRERAGTAIRDTGGGDAAKGDPWLLTTTARS